VLLDPDVAPTQEGYWATGHEVYPSEERPQPVGSEIDEYVRWLLRGTCGNLFDGTRASGYPIPAFPIDGTGRLLDVGSNWGRWSIAAARSGFAPVALDPSLGAVRAARRVARQLEAPVEVVVGDARRLPFPDGSFDVVFSYSVLQHLSPTAVAETAAECARVLRPGGVSLHQLPNCYGARNVYRLSRRRFRRATGFEVRYWRPRDLARTFEWAIGPTVLSADGFLTLNPHPGNVGDLSPVGRTVVALSQALTDATRFVPPLRYLADSLWVRSVWAGDRA
jgi:SAM-dependent methyltransferase